VASGRPRPRAAEFTAESVHGGDGTIGIRRLVPPIRVPAVAAAKGSTLRFEERRYAPGERAVGRAEVETWKGSGRPEDGPYAMYLIRGRQPLWLGHLPSDAIRVGELDIGRLVANDTYRVRAAFHVPPIPDGRYAVWVCRAECGASKMFGDLVYGRIVVARATEAALVASAEVVYERPDGR
jgi:hypothetical protein